MENRNPRLDLKLVPVGGVDRQVDCSLCPAACCREGISIPLTKSEAETLEQAGTTLRKLTRAERKGNKAPFGRNFYEFETACGNLAINAATGETSCEIFGNSERPKACGEFKTGGYNCVATQLTRIALHEDEHIGGEDTPHL